MEGIQQTMCYFYNVVKVEKILGDDTLNVRGQALFAEKPEVENGVLEIEELQDVLLVRRCLKDLW